MKKAIIEIIRLVSRRECVHARKTARKNLDEELHQYFTDTIFGVYRVLFIINNFADLCDNPF